MPPFEVGPPRLQASWAEGRIVVWAGGPGADATPEDLQELLEVADADGIAWERHPAVPIPGRSAADARSAPISQTLGWLVGVGAGQGGDRIGPSLRWLGEIALWGTELVAQGRMVPVVRGASGRQLRRPAGGRTAPGALGSRPRRPGSAARPGVPDAHRGGGACSPRPRPTRSADRCWPRSSTPSPERGPAAWWRRPLRLTPGPGPRSPRPSCPASTAGPSPPTRSWSAGSAEDLKRWAAPVTANHRVGLTVRLDPPQADGGWLLSVEATGVDKHAMPVEHALVVASGTKSQQVEAQLRRLERLLPVLRRPSTRRGQVVLDGDEAVELMFRLGPSLGAAGFDAMLPVVSTPPAPPAAAPVRRGGRSLAGRGPAARQCAVVGLLRRPRARRGRDRGAGQGGQAAGPGPGPLGAHRPGRPHRGGRPRWPNGRRSPSCRGPPSSATPSASRAPAWPGRCASTAAAGPRTCCGAPPPIRRRPSTPPTASPASCAATRPRPPAGWASWIGPASAAAWPWTWGWARRRRCWPTCWSTGATGRRW